MTPTNALPRSAPEAQGIPSEAILAFLDAAERDIRDLQSIMLLRNGAVVAEGWWRPYAPTVPHMLFSLSKSFTSTAIGLLVAEGRLTVVDPVLPYFPELAPAAPSANLQAMRVRHLLTMTAGHDSDPTRVVFESADWAKAFFEQPVPHAPGSHFVYNTAATYMLSALAQRLTGQRLVQYLGPRLFEPLGIADPRWDISPQGIDVGGSGLNLPTEAIARFGQLYLQRGAWQGKQLIPAAWVDQATAYQTPNGPSANVDWIQGYGYQFWRCRHGAYRGDGAFGQYCVVLPEQNAVLAITSGVRNMQQVLDLVWDLLLPAMAPAPLPASSEAATLAGRLAALSLPVPQGVPGAASGAHVSGKTFTVAENADGVTSLRFDITDRGCRLTLGMSEGDQAVEAGAGAWLLGETTYGRTARRPTLPVNQRSNKVAAAGAWADAHTYVAQLWWYETPFGRRLTCAFDGDCVTVTQEPNVGWTTDPLPTWAGRLAGA